MSLKRSHEHQRYSRTLVTIIDNSKNMWKLRELVGSMHKHSVPNRLVVYASLENPDDYEEISCWDRVDVRSLSLVYGRLMDNMNITNDCQVYSDILTDANLSNPLYIPLGLEFQNRINLESIKTTCGTEHTDKLTSIGFRISIKKPVINHESEMNLCWIRHKQRIKSPPDFLRSQISKYYTASHQQAAENWRGKRVAILVPTFNKHDDPVYLTKIFLPSLSASLTTWEQAHFLTTIYIGYDSDDPILKENLLKHITGQKNLIIKLHRLPAIRWATAMWNLLFEDALRDGNDYFLQIGDDVQFNNVGWMAAMTRTLDDQLGIGVVGPSDHQWGCEIMTQAMVTRKHHDIFGWFYPPEIKDWYSDNWLQTTYLNVDKMKCLKDYSVTNMSGLKKRYEACDNYKMANDALHKHLVTLRDYVKKTLPTGVPKIHD